MKKLLKINTIVFFVSMFGLGSFFVAARDEIRASVIYDHIEESYALNNIENLTLKADNRSIELITTLSDEISVEFYTSKIDTYTIGVSESTFAIDLKTNILESVLFNITTLNYVPSPAVHIIKVKVPATQYNKINIMTTNGSIKLSESRASTLTATSSNGVILVEEATFNNASLITHNGAIDVKAMSGEKLTMNTSNGKIKGTNINVPTIETINDNGNIALENITTHNISANTSNGNIEMHINDAFTNYKTLVKTSNGTIKIDNIKTKNGTYNNDQLKTVTAITDNGSINLHFLN